MACKLLDAATHRWRALTDHHLVQELLNGAQFQDGIRTDRAEDRDAV
ncbi:MAG: hypothetical protein Kow0092_13500 [Deferrisomatales bacterium]